MNKRQMMSIWAILAERLMGTRRLPEVHLTAPSGVVAAIAATENAQ